LLASLPTPYAARADLTESSGSEVLRLLARGHSGACAFKVLGSGESASLPRGMATSRLPRRCGRYAHLGFH
jgi:hypothetical protein